MKKFILFWLFLQCATLALYAQQADEEVLSPEFLHVTSDKPFYFEEERLVFQTIALSHKTFKIVQRNDVLIADLINLKGEKIASERFQWIDGIANGEFKLPAIAEEKTTLFLHLYTPSILNASTWVEESHPVSLFSIPSVPLEDKVLQTISQEKEVSVGLYPEESSIYNNLSNQVFFRVKNAHPSASYSLVVGCGAKNPDTLRLIGANVGAFTIAPAVGENCILTLLDEKTVVWEKTLELGSKHGLALEVEADSLRNLEIKIQHTFPAAQRVNVEIRQGSQSVFKRAITLNQPVITVLVPAGSDVQGVAYVVSVTDEQNNVLVKRLVFVEDEGYSGVKWINQRTKLPVGSTPNLLFTVNKDSLDFSKTYLSIKLMDGRFRPAQGIGLYSAGQTFQKYQLRKSGIFVNNLPVEFQSMTSIQKEAWLLTSDDKPVYKRPVLVPDSIQLTPDPFQKGFRITGRITDKETGNPLPYCPLALANTTNFSFFRFSKTNADGYFKFENLSFEGENELFLAMQRYYDKDVNILIDQIRPPHFDIINATDSRTPYEVNSNTLLNEALQRSIIDSVYTGTAEVVKVFQENNFISKIAGFFLEPTEIVDPLEYVPFNDMKDVFKEILPSAYLRFKKKQPLIRMVHSSMQLPSNAVVTGLMHVPSLIIVDGVPIFDQAEVLKINPSYVTRYELYHGLFTLGSEVYLGLVHIVTNVDYLNKTDIKGLVKFKYKGIAPASSIAIGPTSDPGSPYLSPLGFWITVLKPDDMGVVQLPIRLTSVPGDYFLTVETITPDGTASVTQWPLQIE